MLQIALSEFRRRLQNRYSPQMLVEDYLSGNGGRLAVPTIARELNFSYYSDILWQCEWLSHLWWNGEPTMLERDMNVMMQFLSSKVVEK
jgi:hypothetical protein